MKMNIAKKIIISLFVCFICFTSALSASEIETIEFNFENNNLNGWAPSTYISEQGIQNLSISTDEHYDGNSSLAMEVHIDETIEHLKAGMAVVMFPGNMKNQKMTIRIKVPEAASGHYQFPNGIQLVVKDYLDRCQMSSWKNIGEDIKTDEWVTLSFSPYDQADFDITKIRLAGIKIAAGTNTNPDVFTSQPFQEKIYIDSIQISRASLKIPQSDNRHDFNQLTNDLQITQPFGYGPFFNTDPAWDAYAWDKNDISIKDQQIVIQSNFKEAACQIITTESGTYTQCDGKNKGYLGIELKPTVDLSNKDQRIIRAELRFDPPVFPYGMVASFFVFDNTDSGECKSDNDCLWYRSKDIVVGGPAVNEISFDLSDASQFYQEKSDPSLAFTDIQSDSLRNILKVGIQLYANQPYTGTIYLDNITIGGTENKMIFDNLNKGFVVRNGSDLELQGEPFRFAGANNYYLFYKSHYMIDDVMKTLQDNNINVLRTWGFADGKAKYSKDNDEFTPNGNEGSCFQPEAGLYYEPTFQNFDYVIKSAGEHGIRLIIPLVNYWSDMDTIAGANNYGGMAQYLEWCGISPEYENGEIINKDIFFANECAKSYYKSYVQNMLNRVNTLTGIAYKNDPTILAWELANEPRCHYTHKEYCSQNEVYHWISEMSAFIKQNDSNHLVGVGDEGLLNQAETTDDYYNGHFGIDWEKNLSIETIDFGTVHLYPDHWQRDIEWSQNWITDHVTIAEQQSKPIVFEEFGIMYDSEFDRNDTYKRWLYLFEQTQNQATDGDLFWMIAGKVNSSKETHILEKGNMYYMDYDHFSLWEFSDTLTLIANHVQCMQNNVNCLSEPEPELNQDIDIPLTHMNGISLTGWETNAFFNADRALDQLVYDHVNWVGVNGWIFQDNIYESTIYKDNQQTPNEDSLIDTINDAHHRGIQVFLKINLDPKDGEFRGKIVPNNLNQWFSNYQAMMLEYAAIAQKTNVELFSVGCELKSLSGIDYRSHWVTLIEAIRSVYDGKLVYSANWDEYSDVCFWDLMDFIGIDAYFPLDKNNDISRQDIFDRWTDSHATYYENRNWFEEIHECQMQHAKPVIFTEIGYPSANGAAKEPWSNILTDHNEIIQANCVGGTIDFWSQVEWFQGIFLWEILSDLSDHQVNTGNTHILNGKPVEIVIQEAFADPDLISSDDHIPTPFFPSNHATIPQVKTFSWTYTIPPTTNNFKWETGNTMGWYPDTYEDCKAFINATVTSEYVHSGSGALKCQFKLNENVYGYKQGMMWVDLSEPVNLSGRTISVALWIPNALINSNKPNGVQLAFKDKDWKYVDTKWQNITKGNSWVVYQASLPSDVNWSDGADITHIQHMGFKIGAGTGSQVNVEGFLYADDFLFETESPVIYNLQVASDSSFSQLLLDINSVTDIFYQTNQPFTNNTTYYWRVRSKINDTWNAWSKIADFIIQILEPDDRCKPPVSGDWIISQSCTMKNSATAPANVRLQSLSVLTLPDGVTLDIDLKNFNLTVEKGSGVLIKKGATIK
jgi:endo-1,4-beta-mannosidase